MIKWSHSHLEFLPPQLKDATDTAAADAHGCGEDEDDADRVSASPPPQPDAGEVVEQLSLLSAPKEIKFCKDKGTL
jgi:hypothetical protein